MNAHLPDIDLDDLADEVERLQSHAVAEATTKAYAADWRAFTFFCSRIRANPRPADVATVATYLAHLNREGYAPATIRRHMATVAKMHTSEGLPSPVAADPVQAVWSGIRRLRSLAPDAKRALDLGDLKAILDEMDRSTLAGKRDAALLLLGFTAARRRSELAALDVADVEMVRQGIVLHVRRSKTDQAGQGEDIGIPFADDPAYCTRRAVQDYLDAAKDQLGEAITGPLFRGVTRHDTLRNTRLSSKSVALIVKRHVEAIGLDPDAFGAHSLRSGFATAAAEAGVSHANIRRQTGHASDRMVDRYVQRGTLFDEQNAALNLNL